MTAVKAAIVGAVSLKAKELKEVLEDRKFPVADIRLLDAEAPGQLDTYGDEVTFVQQVSIDQFEGMDFVFFADDEKLTRQAWPLARKAGASVIDLSYALENEATARIRSPWVERELGTPPQFDLDPAVVVAAHPLATVLTLLLLRVQSVAGVRSASVTALEPASEHGRKGMDELHQQTVNLLAFQKLPTEIFDVQVAFNLVGRYGERSQPTLEQVEERVLAHLERLGGGRLPVPSLMLLQAPVFHGHIFSAYIELEQPVSAEAVAEALAGEHVSVCRLLEESPSNVNAAGQEEILVSVRADARRPHGLWLFGASDNLKIAALTALDCALALAATRPQGKVQ